jgi:hypothetical protein
MKWVYVMPTNGSRPLSDCHYLARHTTVCQGFDPKVEVCVMMMTSEVARLLPWQIARNTLSHEDQTPQKHLCRLAEELHALIRRASLIWNHVALQARTLLQRQ